MSKAIDAMKEEGWVEIDLDGRLNFKDNEVLCFARSRLQPNAIVDFEKLGLAKEAVNGAYWANKANTTISQIKILNELDAVIRLLDEAIKEP